jgi:putative ABC transport system permease protein
MRPYALLYLYRKWLRIHTAQELLAGLGIAIAVALVFATLVAAGSIAGSASELVHAAAGSANLQIRARDTDGLDEGLLARVEHLPGVEQSAPLLEQTATIIAPNGHRLTVEVIGTNISLAILTGLAHTLPITALSPRGIGLSKASANALGIASYARTGRGKVSLSLRGATSRLSVSAVLGPETFGVLSRALVAVMPLRRLQHLAGLDGRVSRILIQATPGRQAWVRKELVGLAGGRLTVARADQDLSLLRQALGPSDQASTMFAAISALLGFLFAFNALLLTVPERREAIADLRVDGTKRSAIFQMVIFQALCLGVAASMVGLLAGYALARGVFHQSPGYLSQAFTLGTNTVIGVQPLLLSLVGGILATCLASIVPLFDLRRGRALDSVYSEEGAPGNGLSEGTQRWLFAIAVALIAVASSLFAIMPSAAIIVCVLLALATVLAVPVVLAAVLHIARSAAGRYRRLTLLSAALTSLRATTMRSLALAATGAVALFGSVALGGARADLLRGIAGYTSHYVAGADIWLVNPNDNQAVNDFAPGRRAASIARLPGVASVQSFQGSFLNFGSRRLWIIAWPAGAPLEMLHGQVIAGNASVALTRVRKDGWITVSAQLAAEHHAAVGNTLSLPTPTGTVPFRVAATTTNFGWSPGAIVMSTADYSRMWATTAPTALGVELKPGANATRVRDAIADALGPHDGLEILGAHTREAAMTAALGSSIWQRRMSLAGLRLEGTKPRMLRRVLLIEAALMLSAGCLTGAIAGIYGQLVIDSYLKHITGFPVASFATGLRPLEIFALVLTIVLALAALPGWLASRVSPTFALDE